jgi:hypothetical protein
MCIEPCAILFVRQFGKPNKELYILRTLVFLIAYTAQECLPAAKEKSIYNFVSVLMNLM